MRKRRQKFKVQVDEPPLPPEMPETRLAWAQEVALEILISSVLQEVRRELGLSKTMYDIRRVLERRT